MKVVLDSRVIEIPNTEQRKLADPQTGGDEAVESVGG
jgi:hypothetical protein